MDQLDAVFAKFREAEVNLLRELQRKRQEFYYEVRKGKIHFTEAAKAHQKNFLKRLVRFLRDSNLLVLLTTPIIWFVLFPVVFLDLVITNTAKRSVFRFTAFQKFGAQTLFCSIVSGWRI